MRVFPLLLLAGLLWHSHTSAVELFVSPDGNDANPGTRDQPFATLERARGELRRVTSTAGGPRTVWLRGGDYLRTNVFELTSEDSGSAMSPVVWRARPGERVRLVGGLKVTNFSQLEAGAVKGRMEPRAAENVLCAKAVLPAGAGQFKSRGFGRPLTPSHFELFVDGRPMTLAQWPNRGQWERIAGFPEANAEADGHGGKIGKLTEGFFYAGDRPNRWQDLSNVWVHGYWAWDWANSYERIERIDRAERHVRTAPPHGLYGFRKGQRFHFLNILEELDEPGEWFLDSGSRDIYLWPPGDPLTSKTEVLISTLREPLVRLREVSHITMRGLTLEASCGNGVEIQGGTSNRIAGCLLRNLGNYGVVIHEGLGHQVLACDIFDTGDGGVQLRGGDRQTLSASGHAVENCHFARQGRWSKCYVPAVLMEGVGARVSNCLVEEHPHCGILFSGNDHLIEFNEIRHIALETGDVGAIYTGRDYTFRGNRIVHNFIHHTGGIGMGSMGVYMDDCVSGTEIFGNVFYKVQRAAFLGGGRDHQVLNNIFVDCNHAVELDGRGLDRSPVWRGMVDQTMRQRLNDVPRQLYRERYPAMKTLDQYYGPPQGPEITGETFRGVPPENNVVERNIAVGKWLNVYWHATTNLLTIKSNYAVALPGAGNLSSASGASDLFVSYPPADARAKDFRVAPGAEVWTTGFQAIPLEKIGLREDELRGELGTRKAE